MKNLSMNRFARRRRATLAAGLLVILMGLYSTDKISVARAQSCVNDPSPIACENLQLGTATDWKITSPAHADRPDPTNPNNRLRAEVEGYASSTSIATGQGFSLYVNVNGPNPSYPVDWEVFRLGHYSGCGDAGCGGRSMGQKRTITVSYQGDCFLNSTTLLSECTNWRESVAITPDMTSNWVTGQYLIKLTRRDPGPDNKYWESYVPIVVREPATGPPQRAQLLFQASVTTWQAYNTWGGASLYRNDLNPAVYHQPRAYRVSFDRPYNTDSFSNGEPLWWEFWMLRWLEKRGYNVSYATNVDIDAAQDNQLQPPLNPNLRMFLSVGHDEYWSNKERAWVLNARTMGVSLGFFSANTAYWRIRMFQSRSGVPRRVMICYRDLGADLDAPPDTEEETVKFRDNPCSPGDCRRPENAILGVMFEEGAESSLDGFPLVVSNPSHWIYRGIYQGSPLQLGDTLPHIVGVEWDHYWDPQRYPQYPPPPYVLERLAQAVGIGEAGTQVSTDMTIYSPQPNCSVPPCQVIFAAGTIQWAWGLTNPTTDRVAADYGDDAIRRITENVLNQAGFPPPPPGFTNPSRPGTTDEGNATNVAPFAGITAGQSGYVDDRWDLARFNSPAGVAASPDGTIYVTEARNHRVRMIDRARMVSTVAGIPQPTVVDVDTTIGGFVTDVPGAQARFSVPTGIVMSQDGNTLYVSDTGNNCIRTIDLKPGMNYRVTVYTGQTKTDGSGCEAGYREGPADPKDPSAAWFNSPRGLALGSDGALYVADTLNGRIRRIGPDSQGKLQVTTVMASGVSLSGLSQPTAVAVGTDGAVYTVESGPPVSFPPGPPPGPLGQVRQFPASGSPVVLAGGRFGDGGPWTIGSQALLRPADGLALLSGRAFFSDMANYRVRTVGLSGTFPVSTSVGNGRYGVQVGPGGRDTRVVLPRGITLCPSGSITACLPGRFVVADSANHRLLMVNPAP